MDCIFCSIIKGDIPCYKIYEDEKFLAFLDIANDVEGHTLVIPKSHTANVATCESQLFGELMQTAKKIFEHYQSLGYDAANFAINSGKAAGQEVEHLHVHILPRKMGKRETDLAKIAQKLRMDNE